MQQLAKLSNGILLLSLTLLLSSCASYFKRKECEKVNWHEHGKKIAMQGQWLSSNDYVKQCEKAEANIDYGALDTGFKSGRSTYCEPGTVHATGREGKHFNPQMCDGSDIDKLQIQHKTGVRIFCTPDNAFRVAATGWVYNNICPKDLEKVFLVDYHKGRKIYLQGVIEEKTVEMAAANDEIQQIKQQVSRLNHQLAKLPIPPNRPRNLAKKQKEAPEIIQLRSTRNRLRREINGSNRKVSKLNTKKQTLRKEIAALKRERAALR